MIKKTAKFFIVLIVGGLIVFGVFEKFSDKRTYEISGVCEKFGPAEKVSLEGYTGNAMEPFITCDNKFLFFNSLNDGKDTSIYYAARKDQNTFSVKGRIAGPVNGQPPHLDAVASMDASGNFYFTTTRKYPAEFENIYTGYFACGTVESVIPVNGDFYIRTPGHIVMDSEISRDGQALFFCNARFWFFGIVPLECSIGYAVKKNASFYTATDSIAIMKNVNAAFGHCIKYAPSISPDGLELYYTVFNRRKASTEIYVAARKSIGTPFGIPQLIPIKGECAEAVTVIPDNSGIYFHMLDSGIYSIFYMKRN